MHDIQLYKDTYDEYKHLKLAAEKLNIKWQTLYTQLKKVNHPVTGDKARYGCDSDKLAKMTENLFHKTIPYAIDNNKIKYQSKVDFDVKGYKVDVKCSTKKWYGVTRKNDTYRWGFSCKTQEEVGVDFVVCYCYAGYCCKEHGDVEKILLIPNEMIKNKKYFCSGVNNSKWNEFAVTEDELKEFFDML